MALLSRFVPTFDHVSDEDLYRRLHCWEHCALVSFRTQRQVAWMNVRCLREEIARREAARALGGAAGVASFAGNDTRDNVSTLPSA